MLCRRPVGSALSAFFAARLARGFLFSVN